MRAALVAAAAAAAALLGAAYSAAGGRLAHPGLASADPVAVAVALAALALGLAVACGLAARAAASRDAAGLLAIGANAVLLLSAMGHACTKRASQNSAGGYDYDVTTAVGLAELLKLLMSLCIHAAERCRGDPPPPFSGTLFASYSAPALLYFALNTVNFHALALIPPGCFLLLAQLKVLTTAVFSRCLLGRTQPAGRNQAMLLLLVGCVVSQGDSASAAAGAPLGAWGLMLLSVTLSGFTAVLVELLLKRCGRGQSLSVQNAQLYVWGCAVWGLTRLAAPLPASGSWLAGFTPWAWATVLVLGLMGMVTGAVIKFADSIVRVFTTAAASMATALLACAVWGSPFTRWQAAGMLVCAAASWLYASTPAAPERPATPAADPADLRAKTPEAAGAQPRQP
eukprot:TRINITY_DN28641_c0_g1_i1.p1 TRINITY_DN28641_c0_g1~~TRINITY_DN28641_c0_g1_i1.p1  ORF type:complete len:398 (+),score=110.10 TRINITY_DN28641_c0_g1_i1:71-1264(+)